MGIEDIQISEELETNAPSIKYSGDEGPKSPQQMQEMMMAQLEEEYSKYVDDMMEQGMEPMTLQQFLDQAMAEGQMSGGTPLPNDPTKPVNPFQPKPTGPVLPDRQMAANGGIMDIETPKRGRVDGPGSYGGGIGSWFQENIMDPIKENPVVAATVAALGSNYFDVIPGEKSSKGYLDFLIDPVTNVITKPRGKGDNEYTIGEKITEGLAKNIVPALGGVAAGLFTKNTESDTPGLPDDNTGIQLANLKKTANLATQKQGLAGGLNFLPTVASRKYSPEEMAITYAQAANGGRIGFDNGGGIINPFNELETFQLKGLGYDVASKGVEPFGGVDVLKDILRVNQQRPYAMGGRIGFNMGGGADMGAPQMNNAQVTEEAITKIIQKMQDPNLTDEDRAFLQAQLQNFAPQQKMPMMGIEQVPMMAMGGRIGFEEGGGIMDLGGMEKDYRAEGGFVPIGKAEKADDVPARLSVNEFVFTADAVRNAGGGDIDQGAQVMENMMKHLEQGGQVSEESQGMQGARDMFATSERLGDVV